MKNYGTILGFSALVFFFAALLLVTQDLTVVLKGNVAAWVQAIGTLLALAIAIGVPLYIHSKENKDRTQREMQEAERRHQRILSAIYVEIFGFAARCTRDANTWCSELMKEQSRSIGDKSVGDRRDIRDLLKFEPMRSLVYPALAEDQGILEPGIQAALSEFYFRLEAVARDIRRFSYDRKLDTDIEGKETNHLAHVLYDTCAPACAALAELRSHLDDYKSLDATMNEAYQRLFTEPNNLGSNIDEVLETVISKWRFSERP